MLNSYARRTIVALTISSLGLVLGSPYLAATTMQDQKPNAQQKTSDKNGKGSAKDSAGAKPVAKSSEADKLSNERMSTRGLHKGNSDQGGKQDGQAKSKPEQQSTTKPDAQK